MDVGCARLESPGRRAVCSPATDADTRVAPDWLARQLAASPAGAEAIGGEIELDPDEAAALPPAVARRRAAELVERTAARRRPRPGRARPLLRRQPRRHPARLPGASAGWRRLAALEDQELEDRLAAAGVAIHRPRAVRVVTSARTDGRAERGLARDLELGDWLARRCYDGCDYRLADLLAAKTGTVAAILPAREMRGDDRGDGCRPGAPPRGRAARPAAGRRRRLRRRHRGACPRRRRRGRLRVLAGARARALPWQGRRDVARRRRRRGGEPRLPRRRQRRLRAEFVTGLLGPLCRRPGAGAGQGHLPASLCRRRRGPATAREGG